MQPYENPIEISTICQQLEKLGASNILDAATTEACRQAAYLLMKMREMILCDEANEANVKDLRYLLAMQGEG